MPPTGWTNRATTTTSWGYKREVDTPFAEFTLGPNELIQGGWKVASEAMLWWLSDELVRAVRPEIPFEKWIQEQELDGLFTSKEKDQFKKILLGAAKVLRNGATTLVEEFAKGLAS